MLLRKVRVWRMYLLVGAFLLFLLLIVSRDALAPNNGITVTGHVKGFEKNGPKQFVSVSLEGPGRYAAITNSMGTFTIQNVTPGRYTIRVRQGDLVAEFTRDVDGSVINLIVKW